MLLRTEQIHRKDCALYKMQHYVFFLVTMDAKLSSLRQKNINMHRSGKKIKHVLYSDDYAIVLFKPLSPAYHHC